MGLNIVASMSPYLWAAGLIGASDRQQLSYGLQQGRGLVTHDDDFLRIHAYGAEHAGIVYVHQKRLTIGQSVLALLALYRRQRPSLWLVALSSSSPTRVRIMFHRGHFTTCTHAARR